MISRLRNDRGSVTILSALAGVLFIGMLVITIDLGLLILEKNRLSNAVDAAALAGVQELPIYKWKATQSAQNYLERNIQDILSSQVGFSEDKKEIQVQAQKKVNFALAPLLGIFSWEIQASARARIDVVTALRGVVPLAVQKQDFVFGEQYLLKYGPEVIQGSFYRGNFGALALGGSGANNYRGNLAHGYPGIIRVGDWVDTEPGNMAGPTAQGIRARIEECNHQSSTYDHVPKGCKRLALVPIVESLMVNGRSQVQISGFGAFFLESTSRRGHDSFIVGRFIRYAAQGEIGAGEDFGIKAAKLIQ